VSTRSAGAGEANKTITSDHGGFAGDQTFRNASNSGQRALTGVGQAGSRRYTSISGRIHIPKQKDAPQRAP